MSYNNIWNLYKLGLYRKIINLKINTKNKKELHAKIVSLAACGLVEEARKDLEKVKMVWLFRRSTYTLAKDLAPYAPHLSIELLEKKRSSRLLLGALYIHVGNIEKARKFLTNNTKLKKDTEYDLYRSNIDVITPKKRLVILNTYLNSFGLYPLSLKDTSKMPSITNLTAQSNIYKNSKLVTILMTAYNSAIYIGSAIESLLNQTYANIELIIIDDASSDNTKEIIKYYAKKDHRIKPIYLKKNMGTYVAKSIGLKHSYGEFIICHDSDDFAHPIKIEEQVKPLLEDENLVFTTSYWIRLRNNGIYYARAVYPLLRLNPSSPMFRKDIVVKKVGGWDLVRTGADSEFIARLKIVFGANAMKRVKKPLTFGAHREDSLMNAADTGYCERGMSPTRLTYWEAWNEWHIEERRKNIIPYIPCNFEKKRRFEAPESIVCPAIDIRKLYDQ